MERAFTRRRGPVYAAQVKFFKYAGIAGVPAKPAQPQGGVPGKDQAPGQGHLPAFHHFREQPLPCPGLLPLVGALPRFGDFEDR